MQKGTTRGAGLLALGLLVLGVVLLLSNFLIISGFNITALWPLLLVVAGVVILLQGDLTNNTDARTFGITRGTVESASAEITPGEIDVRVHGLTREGRLVSGQYAVNSRPSLDVRDNHAVLRMDRAATPWLSFADWELALSRDLPWQLFISTSLGAVDLDLSDVIMHSAIVATGMGDIRLTCPREAFEPLQLRSAVGDIHIYTPPGARALVRIDGSPLLTIHVDENRYEQGEDGIYIARAADSLLQPVEISVRGTFGDVYLA